MAFTEVADNVHRFADAFVNFYLVEGPEGLTLVDPGLPSMRSPLERALSGSVTPFKTSAHLS
ncbi:hypothetical protein [Arthrobacter sp.]|uniref:hypothetical protein n=1 Tax=Arthrobacter sp. TaxID=1667 RepID=UPI002811627F|nr:hypothetical protein [Arthrobacter sp.]